MKEIMANSNGTLTENPWNGDLKDFFMEDFAYLPFGTLSMEKVKRYGFCGFVKALESAKLSRDGEAWYTATYDSRCCSASDLSARVRSKLESMLTRWPTASWYSVNVSR
jgi:hypothetical protein